MIEVVELAQEVFLLRYNCSGTGKRKGEKIMPQYHSLKMGQYTVTVKPEKRIRHILPYFVGERVKLILSFQNTAEKPDGSTFILFEIFNGEVRNRKDFPAAYAISRKEFPFVGTPIDTEGNIAYCMSFSSNSSTAFPMFSTLAKNTDRWFLGCLGVVVGCIATIVGGIALGIFQVDKFWHIINPWLKP